jgi:hypothetical protein
VKYGGIMGQTVDHASAEAQSLSLCFGAMTLDVRSASRKGEIAAAEKLRLDRPTPPNLGHFCHVRVHLSAH